MNFRRERQLEHEVKFHIEQRIADYVAEGIAPEEARRRVRIEFGGIGQLKEECRDVWPRRWVWYFCQDLRYE